MEPVLEVAGGAAVGLAQDAGNVRRDGRLADPCGQRLPLCDGTDGGDELLPRRVLEQEAACVGSDGGVDVFVEVEGGEHEDSRLDSAGVFFRLFVP
jgi:hypothetical protein